MLLRRCLLRIQLPERRVQASCLAHTLLPRPNDSPHNPDNAQHTPLNITRPPAETSSSSELSVLRTGQIPAATATHEFHSDKLLENLVSGTSARPALDYASLRGLDKSKLASLPSDAFLRCAEAARKDRSMAIMDNVTGDILEIYKGRDRSNILAKILTESTRYSLLGSDMALFVLNHLHPTHSLSMPAQLISAIAMTALTNPQHPIESGSLETLTPILIALLPQFQVPRGVASLNHDPPGFVRATFTALRHLLKLGDEPRALDLFQALVSTSNIPPETFSELGTASKNFKFIILSALVRASLHWNWRLDAAAILHDMIPDTNLPSTETLELAIDAIHTLLEMSVAQDIVACASLIPKFHERSPDFIIPHGLLRLLYNSALAHDMGEGAESLYAHTQSPALLAKGYPPPSGRSLVWMMRYLAMTSRNMHLARTLAKHVVSSAEPIPLQDRAKFIAATAANGFGVQARILWERYAVGKEKRNVTGNASTMVRMVSLFGDLIAKEEWKLRRLGNPLCEPPAKEWLVYVAPTDEVETHSRRWHELRLMDFKGFANHVVEEFCHSKGSLRNATAAELTSLARARFILGEVSVGFEVMKILLARREIPDLHHVNVALSAMAEYDPQNAANVIDRMVEKGVKPDAITFGTVIHFAIVHGNKELVSHLTNQARNLDNGQISLKAVAALIRGSIMSGDNSRGELRMNLRRAKEIIQTLVDASFVCTPNMGKRCVYASLSVDEPGMAYDFWKLLIKDKTEWNDKEQGRIRRLIGAKIRVHCEVGWLERDRGMVMLSYLGERRLVDRRGILGPGV